MIIISADGDPCGAGRLQPSDLHRPMAIDRKPPWCHTSAVMSTMPRPLSSFIGREGVLAEATDLLARNRLVTLTGPGGSGKTRLSIELAARVGAGSPDGVHFVALAAIRDSALVPSAIAQSLGLQDSRGRPLVQHLAAYLAERTVLLVGRDVGIDVRVTMNNRHFTCHRKARPNCSLMSASRKPALRARSRHNVATVWFGAMTNTRSMLGPTAASCASSSNSAATNATSVFPVPVGFWSNREPGRRSRSTTSTTRFAW